MEPNRQDSAAQPPLEMQQFFQVFFEEAAEHLVEMERLLLAIDPAAPDAEDLNAIFRAAHSIKGGASTFGFHDLAAVTHDLESLLDRVRKEEIGLTSDMVDAFLAAGDVLGGLLAKHRGQGPGVEEAVIAALGQRLRKFTEPAAAAVAARELTIELGPFDPPLDAAGSARTTAALARLSATDAVVEEAGAFVVATLATLLSDAEILESLSFDVAPDRVRIEAGRRGPSAPAADDGFGFFDAAPAHPAGAPSPSASPAQDDGFGFFDTAPQPAPEAGFGFFPEVAGSPQPAPAAPVRAAAPVVKAAEDKTAARAVPQGDTSIRVGIDKVDQLINLVGELVITQAMLAQKVVNIGPKIGEPLVNGMADLQRNTRDLQEAVMSIRMLPISFVFNRFPRMLRDLAAKLGKNVELKTFGEKTELDKGVIEKIADPMTHLVRNAVDHGIETPEIRTAAGKTPHGTLTLKAFHQGGNIVIQVADDGAGLSRERILAKAAERGMAVSDAMSDQDVWQLIFEPGFSTAAQVTDVSGRGVGMDVVKRNIQALGGRVEIDSVLGTGTRITVRLPLTLAIMDGMCLGVAGETYIIPLNSVVELVRPKAKDIRTMSGTDRVVEVRDEFLPVIDLAEALGAERSAVRSPVIVIVEVEGAKTALFVDELVGQQQVVVKSLESNYKRVPGVSGATILGDGTVALIVDVAAAVRLARH